MPRLLLAEAPFLPPARRTSAHDKLAHALGVRIVSGDYAEGALLPHEAVLMAELGHSRSVLREAMKTLAAKGLVQARARVGTRVTPRSDWKMLDPDVLAWACERGIDRSLLRDLADLRAAIEPQAAALAAERHDEPCIAAMRRAIAAMRDAAPGTQDIAAADVAFHHALAAASGNAFMRSFSAAIETALFASFTLSAPLDAAATEQMAIAHAAIVDAVEAQDPAAARAATLHVIRMGLRRHGALEADATAIAPPYLASG